MNRVDIADMWVRMGAEGDDSLKKRRRNRMKKFFAAMLALMIALTACAMATEAVDAEKVIGEWYGYEKVEGGYRSPVMDPNLRLTLNADGTACFAAEMFGIDIPAEVGAWQLVDGAVVVYRSDEAKGVDSEDAMKFTIDMPHLDWELEAIGIPAVVAMKNDALSFGADVMDSHPTVRTDVAIEDFNGKWALCSRLEDDGVTDSMEALIHYRYSVDLAIENGTVTYHKEANGSVQRVVEEVALTGNSIVMANPGKVGGSIILHMHTDGRMSIVFDMPEGVYVNFYEAH